MEAVDKSHPGGIMIGTVKDDMLPHVAFRPSVCGMRVGCAQACGDVFGSWAEVVQVVCIEAVCNCNMEESGGDEMMVHGVTF